MLDTSSHSDAEAKELMAKWEAEQGGKDGDADVDDDDDEPLDLDEMMEKFRREVVVTDKAIDCVMLGVADLEQAMEDFEAMTGIKPIGVTSMNGLGTANARVAFDDASCAYLELVGPDPKQTPTALTEKLTNLPEGKFMPMHYAVRRFDCADLSDGWKEAYQVDKVTMVGRDQGLPWMWDQYMLENQETVAGLIPMFIDWREGDKHPAAKLPLLSSLDKVTVRVPDAVAKLLDGIDTEILDAAASDEPLLEVTFTSPKGTHTFTSLQPIGVSFPQEGGLEVQKPSFES